MSGALGEKNTIQCFWLLFFDKSDVLIEARFRARLRSVLCFLSVIKRITKERLLSWIYWFHLLAEESEGLGF